MATTIKIGGTEVNYQDFSVEIPLSPVGVAPSATIVTTIDESVTAGDSILIDIDGTTVFDGEASSAGQKSRRGSVRVPCEHPAATLFSEQVSFNFANPNSEGVLQAALDQSDSGSNFTLDYQPAQTSMGSDYNVENRSVKRVWRDVMDRTDEVWYVEPGGTTIRVAAAGARGTWKSLTAESDKVRLERYDEGSVDTVRNDVTVVGTAGEKVTATATDSTSISTYGKQSETVNVSYISSSSEAQSMANSLLQTDPQAQGQLLVGSNVGSITDPLVNYEVDITDDGMDVSATDLLITQQTIEQGRAELKIGDGTGTSLENVNRQAKSRDDTTEPGTVMPTDRIGDLAITETKISDGGISTPKLQANAVTANEIAAATITADQIDALDLDAGQLSVTDPTSGEGVEFVTDTISGTDVAIFRPITSGFSQVGTSSNPFSTVETQQLTAQSGFIEPSGVSDISFGENPIGDGNAYFGPDTDDTGVLGVEVTATTTKGWAEVYAHNYVTLSPDPIESVAREDLLASDWHDNPPGPVADAARAIGGTDSKTTAPDGHIGVELGTMTNWLFEALKSTTDDLADAEQRIDDLEQRLSRLEEQV